MGARAYADFARIEQISKNLTFPSSHRLLTESAVIRLLLNKENPYHRPLKGTWEQRTHVSLG